MATYKTCNPVGPNTEGFIHTITVDTYDTQFTNKDGTCAGNIETSITSQICVPT